MTPVHTDTRKFNFFDPLLLIMAAIMVIQGLMIPNDIPILAGIGVMVFLAFTRHTRYPGCRPASAFEDPLRLPRSRQRVGRQLGRHASEDLVL